MKPNTKFLLDKAISFLKVGNHEAAYSFLIQAKKIESNNTVVLRHLALCKSFEKKYGESLQILNEVISIDPKNFLAHSNKGNNLHKLRDYHGALASHIRALEINPQYFEAWTNKGNVLYDLGRYEEALACHTRSLEIESRYTAGWTNKGNVLYEMGRYEEALACHNQALEIEPMNTQAWTNMGYTYQAIMKNDYARKCYEKALFIENNNAIAHENLGILLLTEKKFKLGWKEFEWRWQSENFTCKRFQSNKKRWNGIDGGKLLVWGEQGIGDQILFSSYLKTIEDLGLNTIALIDKKILTIFKESFPKINFYSDEKDIKEDMYDFHIPIGSIPSVFNLDSKEIIKKNYPYLCVDNQQIKFYKEIISENNKYTCGISWRSINPKYGVNKSIDLLKIVSNINFKNLKFINLQYDHDNNELQTIKEKTGQTIHNIKDVDLFNDLKKTQSLACACDFIVTTCNTTAHLIGASGKKAFLLAPISRGKFWYWHHENNKSIWYPSIEIFEQEHSNDWDDPLIKIKMKIEQEIG